MRKSKSGTHRMKLSGKITGKGLLLAMLPLCILALTLLSCHSTKEKTTQGVIMVSIEPLCYFTEQIAGNRFDVASIVPENYSPELYEPTPQQLIETSNAKAYIKIGQLGFEKTWLKKICENESRLPIFCVTDSIESDANGMKITAFDPHVWTSPRYAETICRKICSSLCQIDSAGTLIYQKNLLTCIKRIYQVDKKIHQTLKDVQCRTFVTAHPSFTYFASDYGLTQLCIEKDGKEPTPQELAELIRQCKQENVKVILIQPGFDKNNAEAIARETGAHIVNVNPLNKNWEVEMLLVAKALKDGK